MKHLTAVLFLSLAAASAVAQTTGSEKQESKAAGPAPPPSQGPSVQRSSDGVVVIRSSSAATQAARAKAAKDAEDANKAEKTPEQPAPKKEAEAKKPQPPKARNIATYTYGSNGEKEATLVTASERNSESGSESTQTIVGTGGRQIPYISTKENVVTKTANQSVVERRVQRYDTQGQPTRQALVREEERKLPNGVEKITTVYEEDVNGSLRPAERTVARETATGNKTRTVVTTERPNLSGGFQTVEQRESVETRQGESAAVVETVVSRPSVNGRFTEAKRERSVMQKSGSTATTETEVWERSTASGEVTLSKRTVGKLVERPDGSATETIEVYGQGGSGGGASDTNAGAKPRLEESVQREIAVKPNGEKVETTTKQTRSIADPSRFGQREVVQKVSRPTRDGEAVETHVYEQGVNGKMRPTQSSVEQVKK